MLNFYLPDKHSPINVPFYTKDTYLGRENMDDHTIDTQGKLILDLCKAAHLEFLMAEYTNLTHSISLLL